MQCQPLQSIAQAAQLPVQLTNLILANIHQPPPRHLVVIWQFLQPGSAQRHFAQVTQP
ncbi:hypothetical protein D3C80_1528980 [compost metagenome]